MSHYSRGVILNTPTAHFSPHHDTPVHEFSLFLPQGKPPDWERKASSVLGTWAATFAIELDQQVIYTMESAAR